MDTLKGIYRSARKASDAIEVVIKFISALLLLFCCCSVMLQVVNRYILVKQTLFPWTSVSWTDELSRLMLVSLSYVTMGMCYKHGQLSRADMVYSRLTGRAKRILYYVEFCIISVFLYAAIKYGIQFAIVNKIYTSESLNIPGNLLYMIPVVGFILMSVQVIVEFLGVLSHDIEPFESIVHPSPEDGGSVDLESAE